MAERRTSARFRSRLVAATVFVAVATAGVACVPDPKPSAACVAELADIRFTMFAEFDDEGAIPPTLVGTYLEPDVAQRWSYTVHGDGTFSVTGIGSCVGLAFRGAPETPAEFCPAQLVKVREAVEAYQKSHGTLPERIDGVIPPLRPSTDALFILGGGSSLSIYGVAQCIDYSFSGGA